MTDPLALTPDGVRAVARNLDDRSGDVNRIRTAAVNNTDGAGSPWGDDKMGDKFAKGASGYLAQVDYVKQILDNVAAVLDTYAGGLKTAADTLEQGDHG